MKTKNVKVSLPQNVKAEELSLYQPYLNYELPPQTLRTYKNVFVTYTGYCLKYNGLVKESHHDYEEQLDYYYTEVARYYNNANDHPENLISLNDDNVYLLIHHPYYNYYHWICESVFRAWMARKRINNLILLMPEHQHNTEYMRSSLEPFNFQNIYIIPYEKSLFVKKLCVPQIKQKTDSYDVDMLLRVRKLYLDYFHNSKNITLDFGERIYISRRRSRRRAIENEEDILPILSKYGFKVLYNEDYTFFEQVAIYSKCKYLISIHGAGMTNMLFMKDNASVLELYKRTQTSSDYHSKVFWYLADGLDFKYFQQSCKSSNEYDDFFHANLIVDYDEFSKNLSLMLNE